MTCDKCGSKRIFQFSGKCSDLFNVHIGNHDHDGYVPGDLGLGSGDYLEGDLCGDCGKLQGKFPLKKTALERGEEEE